MTKRTHLLQWVEQLNKAHVLVVGDVMLDRFVYGAVARISPEAPVPVLTSLETKTTLGGAGNVVRNIAAFGAGVDFVSMVGNDSEGQEIKTMVGALPGIRSHLLVEEQRHTTLKVRFIAERQQVLRVDRETICPMQHSSERQAMRFIRESLEHCSILVLSDYAKGLLSPAFLRRIIDAARSSGKPVLVDPKGKDYARYRGATMLTPNLKELSEATRLPVHDEACIIAAARRLIGLCRCSAVLVTRSQEGMSLIEASGDVQHFDAEAKEIFDVSGAGDTALAVMAAACGASAPLPDAAELANVAAGIVVGKVGTAIIRPSDLVQAVHHQELSTAEAKVCDMDTALDRVEMWRRCGYIVGFTSGIFDLLHQSHLQLLNTAKQKCDRLVVAMNSDASVLRLRGEEPVQHESTRSAILASLEIVDMVVVFAEDVPLRLLESLHPQIVIKGTNGNGSAGEEANMIRSYGGKIVRAVLNHPPTHPALVQLTSDLL